MMSERPRSITPTVAAAATVEEREAELQAAHQKALALHLRARNWRVKPAPEVGDVIWGNLRVRPTQTGTRRCVVNLLLALVLLFFTTPITMVSALLAASQPTESTSDDGE